MGEIVKLPSIIQSDFDFENVSIRKSDIISLSAFYDVNEFIINSFVRTIHLITFQSPLYGRSDFLFFTSRDGSKKLVLNSAILNFFLEGAQLYSTNCGIILIWGTSKIRPIRNFLCSTLDMEEFYFHNDEFSSFFQNYLIFRIRHINGKDLAIVKNLSTKDFEVKEINSQINLQKSKTVSISFSDYSLY